MTAHNTPTPDTRRGSDTEAGHRSALAAVCREFGAPLQLEEIRLAPPGRHDVVVEIDAVAICHSDIAFIDGSWGGDLPAVYGHEAAGRIVEVGDEVTSCRPGQRVVVTLIRSCGSCDPCDAGVPTQCATTFDLDRDTPLTDSEGVPLVHAMRTGAFADAAVVHASQVVAVPDTLDPAAAALLACGVITGVGAVRRAASVGPTSDVVIVGAGGVGINAIQGARLAGARQVIAVDISADKLAAATEFGATATVDASSADPAEGVRALTEGRGASTVLVTVGSGAAIQGAVDLLAPGGELVVVGMPAVGVTTTFDPSNLAALGQRIVGTKMGNAVIADDIPALVAAWEGGDLKLDELVSERFSFARINDAIEAARTPDTIRVVVEIDR